LTKKEETLIIVFIFDIPTEAIRMNSAGKKKKMRSPSYPLITLDKALKNTKKLWEREETKSMSKEAAVKHLGYESYEGHPARVIAAMKSFGLISGHKKSIKLTSFGVDIATAEPKSRKYKDTLKELALTPEVYRTLYREYGGNLPSDEQIETRLIKEYGYNPNYVHKLVARFRHTLKTAKLDDPITEEQQQASGLTGTYLTTAAAVGTRSYSVTLESGEEAQLFLPKLPVKIEDLKRIKGFIDLMAPVWTKEQASEE
jgi:hypothetical protein